jgi:hypothetical protein
MTYEFLREAQDEFREAVLRYESKELGLGSRFRNEVARVIERILFDPSLWRERAGGYRRVNLPVFPFYIAYFIRDEKIVIAAVAHSHQASDYWKERILDS